MILVIDPDPITDVEYRDVYELVFGYHHSNGELSVCSTFYTPMEVETLKLFLEWLEDMPTSHIKDMYKQAYAYFDRVLENANDVERLAVRFAKEISEPDAGNKRLGNAKVNDYTLYYWDEDNRKHNVDFA